MIWYICDNSHIHIWTLVYGNVVTSSSEHNCNYGDMSLYKYILVLLPVMGDHMACTGTLSMSRYMSKLNWLRSADTCLTRTQTVICWLTEPGITDSVNICVFYGKIAGTVISRQWAHISVPLYDDREQYFTVVIKIEVNTSVCIKSKLNWVPPSAIRWPLT